MSNSSPSDDPQPHPIQFDIPTPRFSVSSPASLSQAMEYLNDHGYVVIGDSYSQQETSQYYDDTWTLLESLPHYNLQRSDPRTWNKWPGVESKGLISGNGIGHSKLQWNIRKNKNVRKIFSTLWNTDELICSYDGIGIYRPYLIDSSWTTRGRWFHVDQNPHDKPNKCCVQGFVSLFDQNEYTGGLVVIPGSHKEFSKLKSVRGVMKGVDYVSVLDISKEFETIASSCKPIKFVACKQGDVVLWDSRTIHCNTPSKYAPINGKGDPVGGDRKEIELKSGIPSSRLLRVVNYVCITPREYAFKYNGIMRGFTLLNERILCVGNAVSTTHWPFLHIESEDKMSDSHWPTNPNVLVVDKKVPDTVDLDKDALALVVGRWPSRAENYAQLYKDLIPRGETIGKFLFLLSVFIVVIAMGIKRLI